MNWFRFPMNERYKMFKMKTNVLIRQLCFFFFLCTVFDVLAQYQIMELNASAGNSYEDTSYFIDWSIGEVMTEYFFNEAIILNQGLHQPHFGVEQTDNNLHITNLQVAFGNQLCFDANDTITVAGDGSSVTVNDGGVLNLVAGKVIRLNYGFSVQHGGTFNAWIDTTGNFCGQKESTLLASLGSNDLTGQIVPFAPDNNDGESLLFKAYPNPTNGSFTVELMFDCESPAVVEIFTIMGNLVMKTGSSGKKLIVCDLTGKQAGVYIVRVSNQERTGQQKIIKNN